jgi:hypothetical protein
MHHPRSHLLLIAWLAILLTLIALPLRAQSPTPPATPQSNPPLTLAEYRAELAAAIAQLEAAPPERSDALVREVQRKLESITAVQLPTGEQMTITPLLESLPTAIGEGFVPDEEPNLLTLRGLALQELRGAVAQIDASASDNTAARLAILTEILARPEFNTPMSLWDRFWQWLKNLLTDLLPDSQSNGSGWLAMLIRLIPWLLTILVVAAVIWLLSYWLQRLLRSFVSDARLDRLAGEDDLPRSAAEARQQARAAAQSGLYRDAVRRLYLAALLQLSEHGLISYERSLTNREVLTRVPADSPIRPHLEPVIATFDQVWYGVREPDQATFTAYEQEIDTLATVAQRIAADPARRGEA